MNAIPQHHPDKNVLVEFVSGSLDHAQSIAVSAHLHYCAHCRNKVATLEHIGGTLFSLSESADQKNNNQSSALSSPCFDTLMSRIESNEQKVTTQKSETEQVDHLLPPKYKTLPSVIRKMLANSPPSWQRVTASLSTANLVAGQSEYGVSLQKISAGGKVPQHDHRGAEMTVVLKGSFSDEDNVYQQGDFLLKNPGDIHRPRASSNEDCLCLSVEQAPVKLTGLFTRWLNPFIRINPA